VITFVVQKTREIGTLKAIGASSHQIMALFLAKASSWGPGSDLGFGLGLLAVVYRNDFLFLMRRVTGFELFPAKIYYFSELPAAGFAGRPGHDLRWITGDLLLAG